ncbi:MAG TPA: beta-galactosidase family protein [Candidatus Limnocylindrales bacterium]
MGKFEVIGGAFVRDGEPHRVLSGAMHYFRVLPEQWRHRLKTMRAMGLNCVETYVPWNLHEPRPGEFSELGRLGEFLALAKEEGLDAIVRPGPYICAEWDNGGLPAWLTGRPGIALRCMDPTYLGAVDSWFDRLVPEFAEHQVTRGGNVLMVQVENEYGSYGSDLAYLRHLADGLRRRGIDVPLFTSDGPTDLMLTGGTIPGVLATVNFGSDPEQAFEVFRRHRPKDPLFCMEFWCGWFDHWGGEHTTRDPADAAGTLRRILDSGASVNIYMAHGGTNFGTWAGANRGEPEHCGALQPDVTSYDYDAPIDEHGRPTEKFFLFQEILRGYTRRPLPPLPEPTPRVAPQTVALPQRLRLFDALDGLPSVESPAPPSFEDLGIDHGLVIYRFSLPGPRQRYPLKIVADWVTGVPDSVAVEGDRADFTAVVESMGRTNYGPLLGETKGLGQVRHGQQIVHGFTATPFPLNDISALPWAASQVSAHGPVFSRGWLELDEPGDAAIATPGCKGYIWVNGFLLGRYWNAGPQDRLYLPWPLLRMGRNEIVVLELDGEPVTSLSLL